MFDNIQMPLSGPAQGAISFGEAEGLRKALEAGYGTDVAALTSGGALRIQSLDTTMKATIQENKHFALFNALVESKATATVDEWTEQSSVGGFVGDSTNTETGNIDSAQGDYARRVGMVKYLMTRREVSFVSTIQNNMVQAEAVEARNGAIQLLTSAEHLCFEGDAAVVPTEFDGIGVQIAGLNSAQHVLDAAGAQLNSINLIDQAAANIAGFGNFGTPTHLFMSQLTQSDFNTNLDPAFRIALDSNPNSIMLGAPVIGIRTSWGDIRTVHDVFVRDENQQQPFDVLYPAVASAQVALKPASAAPVANASGGADTKFGAAHAGNYYYAVAGLNAKGQSQVLVSAQVAVISGGSVTLTIGRSAGAQETGYAIYRSRKNGTNALADFRLVKRIPVAGATTVFTDKNLDIPGTTKAYLLSMSPGADAIAWRQFLPMTKFPLYPTVSAVVPWAQLLFGYLRISKRKHHVVIKNIVPSGAVWKPFG